MNLRQENARLRAELETMYGIRRRRRAESEAAIADLVERGVQTDRAHGHDDGDGERWVHKHFHPGPHDHEDHTGVSKWGGYYPGNEFAE